MRRRGRSLAVNGLRLLGPRTAIGRHLEYLAQYWSRHSLPFDTVDFYAPGPAGVDDLGHVTPVHFHSTGAGVPNLIWEQLVFPWAARRAAVVLGEYTGPILAPTAPMVIANHGIYEALPTTFSAWQRFRATAVNRPAARRAVRVIANSQNTKADLQRFFSVPACKIDVVYPGPADVFFREHDPDEVREVVRATFGDEQPFVISVGKMSARRHVANTVEAMRAVREAGCPHRLLIVGPDTNGVDPLGLARKFGIDGAVVHIEHLDQDRLAMLCHAADAYVLASTYEGISWTMFEAMASGTAVLSVDHCTLVEGAGDTAYVVADPRPATLAAGLIALLSDDPLRNRLASAGRARAEQFSLQRSAEATTQILIDVAGF